MFFLCFLASLPQDGIQGAPGQSPRPKSTSKWVHGPDLSYTLSQLCHTFRKHFGDVSCDVLVTLDVQFNVV